MMQKGINIRLRLRRWVAVPQKRVSRAGERGRLNVEKAGLGRVLCRLSHWLNTYELGLRVEFIPWNSKASKTMESNKVKELMFEDEF